MRVVKWVVFVCCLLLLWCWWQCSLLMASDGGLLAQRPAFPRLTIAAPLSMQVTDTSYTLTGSPSISASFIDQVLSAYGSPAARTGQALYDLGMEYGIDPVYALAFFLHENSFGETGIGAANHSLGNIRCSLAMLVSTVSGLTRRGKMAIRIGMRSSSMATSRARSPMPSWVIPV